MYKQIISLGAGADLENNLTCGTIYISICIFIKILNIISFIILYIFFKVTLVTKSIHFINFRK